MFFQNRPKPLPSQHGQVLIVLLIFALVFIGLLSFKNGPLGTTVTDRPKCITFPPANTILPQMPAIEKGVDFTKNPPTTNFVLVRNKVPITKSFFKLDDGEHYFWLQPIKVINGKRYYVFYPHNFAGSGEIDTKELIVSKYRHPGEKKTLDGRGQLYFSDFKVIFLVPLEPNGLPLEKNGPDDHNQPATFWIADVYQQQDEFTGSPTSGAPHPLPDEVFSCANNASIPPSQTVNLRKVTQNTSVDKKQLQLEYFLFKSQTITDVDGWSAHCKPAIYLYPTQPTQVNVKVNTTGFLTYTDPPYPQDGWNVLAQPSGQLTNLSPQSSMLYDYLYYESKVPDKLINKPTQGFTVEYNQLTNLYQYLLPKLGLDSQQTKDFTNYWQKALPYSTYYFVGILDPKNIDQFEPLDITPKPNTNIRVRLYFEAKDQQPETSLPTSHLSLLTSPLPLPLSPSHNGFTMVEWGGMVKLDKSHPFTCSQ